MKKMALILGLFGLIQGAYASSVASCDPVVVAREISMACVSKPKTYMISIQLLKSPKECVGDNQLNSKKATVNVYAKETHLETVEIVDRDFEYSINSAGLGSFKSPINGFNFSKCSLLPIGGISIGN